MNTPATMQLEYSNISINTTAALQFKNSNNSYITISDCMASNNVLFCMLQLVYKSNTINIILYNCFACKEFT